MGCCKPSKLLNQSYEFCCSGMVQADESSFEFLHEETQLQDWENQLMFNTLRTKDLTEELLTHCKSEIIPLQVLQTIMQNLGYRGSVSCNFDRFSQGPGYSFLMLYLSAVLLGTGSNEEKIVCLFALLDPSGSGCTSREEFSTVISEILSLGLCEKFGEDLDSDSDLVSRYLGSLRSMKYYTISKLISALCTEEKITFSMLNTAIAGKDLWFMLSSRDLRGWMLSQVPIRRYPSVEVSHENPFEVADSVKNNANKVLISEEDTMITKPQRKTSDSVISIVSKGSNKLPSMVEEEILLSFSDSEEPIQIRIQVSSTDFEIFSFYPVEDPVAKAEEFALQNKISNEYKSMLISELEKFKQNLE